MARNIQSQSSRSPARVGPFLGLLTNALFWLLVAILVPVGAIAEAFPRLAPYIHWAPVLFYALAFWSFARAVRALQRRGAARLADVRTAATAQAERPGQQRHGKVDPGPPVRRTPTVQRMR